MSTFLVTGGNRGIGLELCKQLSARGDCVIAACRASSKALQGTGAEIHDKLEVTDDASVQRLAKALDGRTIDVLINCAGILTRESLDDLNVDQIRKQFEVNAIGPLRVTAALLSNLKKGSKVAIVTSRMGSVEDNTSGGRYGYRMSKAAVNMAGRSLAWDLKDQGIAVVLLHPGMVATEMTGRQGIPPEEAARGLIERIDELDMQRTGTFWHQNGEALPW
ncbi:MAG: SDR family oxidoreductase [Gammaproteobacteria bacterium]|nr:SDR family oxidoreductase [Gammaproteobacteria bacterium]MDH3411825.1 SDR family oxidoreductase [Gammaproteobacteria bacterium]